MNTATVTPLRPQNQVHEHMPVTVSYGPNSQEFEVPTASTVGTALDNSYIKEIIGFKGGKDESITVNGQPTDRDRVLVPGDRVEVIKRAGEKA